MCPGAHLNVLGCLLIGLVIANTFNVCTPTTSPFHEYI